MRLKGLSFLILGSLLAVSAYAASTPEEPSAQPAAVASASPDDSQPAAEAPSSPDISQPADPTADSDSFNAGSSCLEQWYIEEAFCSNYPSDESCYLFDVYGEEWYEECEELLMVC